MLSENRSEKFPQCVIDTLFVYNSNAGFNARAGLRNSALLDGNHLSLFSVSSEILLDWYFQLYFAFPFLKQQICLSLVRRCSQAFQNVILSIQVNWLEFRFSSLRQDATSRVVYSSNKSSHGLLMSRISSKSTLSERLFIFLARNSIPL